MKYTKTQDLNDWTHMLSNIYDSTANHGKNRFEIFSHLTEVSLAFGKFTFKDRDLKKARDFLPKIFSWTIALVTNVKGGKTNLEEIILTKFPRVCPYCLQKPCSCMLTKKNLNNKSLKELFYKNSSLQSKSLDDFQLMFKEIYEHTWGLQNLGEGSDDFYDRYRYLFLRFTEELSELSESLRFYSIYPSNFDNEVADLLAWWFALASSFSLCYSQPMDKILCSDLLWEKYPNICQSCMLNVCDCRPGPVREMLSKPSLKELEYVDGLTFSNNKLKFDQDIQDIKLGNLNIPIPIACIRIDLDDFKIINNDFSHETGDDALRYIVNVFSQKMRTRDRFYRLGGDEFGILCPDLSVQEAVGMVKRASTHIKNNPIRGMNNKTNIEEDIKITFSVGITECNDIKDIEMLLSDADNLAIRSKQGGKDKITIENNVS